MAGSVDSTPKTDPTATCTTTHVVSDTRCVVGVLGRSVEA